MAACEEGDEEGEEFVGRKLNAKDMKLDPLHKALFHAPPVSAHRRPTKSPTSEKCDIQIP